MKNPVTSPIFVSSTKKISKASIKKSSPYPKARASFNWLNVDFPYLHTHNHWEIFIMIKGKLEHTLNNYKEICSQGYACLIRPTDCHRLEYVDNEKNIQFINFTFSNETAQKIFEFYNDYSFELQSELPLHFSLEYTFIDSIINQALIAQAATQQAYEQHSMLIVHQLLTIYLSQRLNSNAAYPNWLNNFLYRLHNPKCFELSTHQLAMYTFYSYSHLSRIFKQYTGKTLIEYINELKVVYAKRLLRSTQKTILDISLELGFNSVSSLNHLFKDITTLSPLQYRKKYRDSPHRID